MEKKILIVDDDKRIVNLYQLVLKEYYDIIVAYNGQEALDLVNVQMPDLIVMDIMMPVMDGLQALTKLKKDPITATIPVILLTGRDRHKDVLGGYKMGADYYITKPFTSVELLNGISLFLEKKEGVDSTVSQESLA